MVSDKEFKVGLQGKYGIKTEMGRVVWRARRRGVDTKGINASQKIFHFLKQQPRRGAHLLKP